jgi:hypothetical protein
MNGQKNIWGIDNGQMETEFYIEKMVQLLYIPIAIIEKLGILKAINYQK